jgi:hypothetical protein
MVGNLIAVKESMDEPKSTTVKDSWKKHSLNKLISLLGTQQTAKLGITSYLPMNFQEKGFKDLEETDTFVTPLS